MIIDTVVSTMSTIYCVIIYSDQTAIGCVGSRHFPVHHVRGVCRRRLTIVPRAGAHTGNNNMILIPATYPNTHLHATMPASRLCLVLTQVM